jgi:hypothetical protein
VLLNGRVLVTEAQRHGLFAVGYLTAAEMINDPKNQLSAGDRQAATDALRALADERFLEGLGQDAAGRISDVLAGKSEAAELDLVAAKLQVRRALVRAGASPAALEKADGALADVPDVAPLLTRAQLEQMPLGVGALLGAAFRWTVVAGIVCALLVLAAGSIKDGLICSGATVAVSGGIGLTLFGLVARAIAAANFSLADMPNFQAIPLDASRLAEIESALGALLGRVISLMRLGPAMAVGFGGLLVFSGWWAGRRGIGNRYRLETGLDRAAAPLAAGAVVSGGDEAPRQPGTPAGQGSGGDAADAPEAKGPALG